MNDLDKEGINRCAIVAELLVDLSSAEVEAIKYIVNASAAEKLVADEKKNPKGYKTAKAVKASLKRDEKTNETGKSFQPPTQPGANINVFNFAYAKVSTSAVTVDGKIDYDALVKHFDCLTCEGKTSWKEAFQSFFEPKPSPIYNLAYPVVSTGAVKDGKVNYDALVEHFDRLTCEGKCSWKEAFQLFFEIPATKIESPVMKVEPVFVKTVPQQKQPVDYNPLANPLMASVVPNIVIQNSPLEQSIPHTMISNWRHGTPENSLNLPQGASVTAPLAVNNLEVLHEGIKPVDFLETLTNLLGGDSRKLKDLIEVGKSFATKHNISEMRNRKGMEQHFCDDCYSGDTEYENNDKLLGLGILLAEAYKQNIPHPVVDENVSDGEEDEDYGDDCKYIDPSTLTGEDRGIYEAFRDQGFNIKIVKDGIPGSLTIIDNNKRDM